MWGGFTSGDHPGSTWPPPPGRQTGPRCSGPASLGCPTVRRSSALAAPHQRRSDPRTCPPWGSGRRPLAKACHLRRRLDPPGDLAGRQREDAGARIDHRLLGPDGQQGLHGLRGLGIKPPPRLPGWSWNVARAAGPSRPRGTPRRPTGAPRPRSRPSRITCRRARSTRARLAAAAFIEASASLVRPLGFPYSPARCFLVAFTSGRDVGSGC